jgi:hypothetical protein
MRRRTAALLALIALTATGCGGDDEPANESADELDTPALTVPGGDAPELQETTPDGTSTTPSTTPGEPGTGGTPAPGGGTAPDGPGNDTPPAPGSPPDQFEDFCNENPAACE